jgi:hypothetical protein
MEPYVAGYGDDAGDVIVSALCRPGEELPWSAVVALGWVTGSSCNLPGNRESMPTSAAAVGARVQRIGGSNRQARQAWKITPCPSGTGPETNHVGVPLILGLVPTLHHGEDMVDPLFLLGIPTMWCNKGPQGTWGETGTDHHLLSRAL